MKSVMEINKNSFETFYERFLLRRNLFDDFADASVYNVECFSFKVVTEMCLKLKEKNFWKD